MPARLACAVASLTVGEGCLAPRREGPCFARCELPPGGYRLQSWRGSTTHDGQWFSPNGASARRSARSRDLPPAAENLDLTIGQPHWIGACARSRPARNALHTALSQHLAAAPDDRGGANFVKYRKCFALCGLIAVDQRKRAFVRATELRPCCCRASPIAVQLHLEGRRYSRAGRPARLRATTSTQPERGATAGALNRRVVRLSRVLEHRVLITG